MKNPSHPEQLRYEIGCKFINAPDTRDGINILQAARTRYQQGSLICEERKVDGVSGYSAGEDKRQRAVLNARLCWTVAVEEWLAGLHLANGSKAKVRNVMHALFNHAMRYEWTEKIPLLSRVKGQSGCAHQTFLDVERHHGSVSIESTLG